MSDMYVKSTFVALITMHNTDFDPSAHSFWKHQSSFSKYDDKRIIPAIRFSAIGEVEPMSFDSLLI